MVTKLDHTNIKDQIAYLKSLTEVLPDRYQSLQLNPLDLNKLFEYVGLVAQTVDFLAQQQIVKLEAMVDRIDDGK
jgi:hypothetical protein